MKALSVGQQGNRFLDGGNDEHFGGRESKGEKVVAEQVNALRKGFESYRWQWTVGFEDEVRSRERLTLEGQNSDSDSGSWNG